MEMSEVKISLNIIFIELKKIIRSGKKIKIELKITGFSNFITKINKIDTGGIKEKFSINI